VTHVLFVAKYIVVGQPPEHTPPATHATGKLETRLYPTEAHAHTVPEVATTQFAIDQVAHVKVNGVRERYVADVHPAVTVAVPVNVVDVEHGVPAASVKQKYVAAADAHFGHVKVNAGAAPAVDNIVNVAHPVLAVNAVVPAQANVFVSPVPGAGKTVAVIAVVGTAQNAAVTEADTVATGTNVYVAKHAEHVKNPVVAGTAHAEQPATPKNDAKVDVAQLRHAPALMAYPVIQAVHVKAAAEIVHVVHPTTAPVVEAPPVAHEAHNPEAAT